jgi:hypothetical protein
MLPGALEQWVWYLNILVTALLLGRLFTQGLAYEYRALTLYLAADILQQVPRLFLAASPWWSAMDYFAGQAVKVVLAIFVVLELYQLALENQPALARFGRRTVWYLVGTATAVSAVGLLLDLPRRRESQPILLDFLRFERSLDLMALVLLAAIIVFLLWFPVRVRRNVALYIGGFVIYTFQRWAGLLVTNLWPALLRPMSTIMLCVSFACLAIWLVLLRREDDRSTTVIGHRWSEAEADRLVGQLNAINARLARSVRP